MAAAKSSSWRIVKTSGGFGVQQRVGGAKITKSTIVKPAVSGQVLRTGTAMKFSER
jgi:hypothetical protein